MEQIPIECIDEMDVRPIGGDEHCLAIGRELQPGPIAILVLGQLERVERSLIKRPQVVQLD